MMRFRNTAFLGILVISLIALAVANSVPKPWDKNAIIDDCSCTAVDVDTSNQNYIYPLLHKLTRQTFFKYFKVNLYSDCPFWAQKVMCGLSGGCSVCECDEEEIPKPWKVERTDILNKYLNSDFSRWTDNEEDLWFAKEENQHDMTYVNLLLNPEANTGYSGEDAGRVWRATYNENCFKGSVEDMCLEQRVFFNLISGLHTSINTHVMAYYHKTNNATGNGNGNGNGHSTHVLPTFEPNLDYFEQRLMPFPDRIKNMYVLFTFYLRAFQKASAFLKRYDYNTGNPVEDNQTRQMMSQLLDAPLTCSPTFDESLMFRDKEKTFLRDQMRNHMRNITLIMNCVSCEKCKAWAKLQTLGLATAFKIVLSDNPEMCVRTLQRNEIIALLNSLNQVATSIEDVKRMQGLVWQRKIAPLVGLVVLFVACALFLEAFKHMMRATPRSKLDHKKKAE